MKITEIYRHSHLFDIVKVTTKELIWRNFSWMTSDSKFLIFQHCALCGPLTAIVKSVNQERPPFFIDSTGSSAIPLNAKNIDINIAPLHPMGIWNYICSVRTYIYARATFVVKYLQMFLMDVFHSHLWISYIGHWSSSLKVQECVENVINKIFTNLYELTFL